MRLDWVVSQHNICDHSDERHARPIDLDNILSAAMNEDRVDKVAPKQNIKAYLPKFPDMHFKVELVPLECAFSYLKTRHLEVYQHAALIIAEELDAKLDDPSDWVELVTNGWDFTLWTFWIYILLVLHLVGKDHDMGQWDIPGWVHHMIE